MSCKQKRGIRLFLFVATGYYFYALQLCSSVSLGQRGDDFTSGVKQSASTRWARSKEDAQQEHRDEEVTGKSTRPGIHELRPEPAASPGEPLPHFTGPNNDEPGVNFAPTIFSWTVGNVTTKPRSTPESPPDFADGYQADSAGFEGKVLGLSSESSPHFSSWEAMSPEVKCDDDVMTFTASGEGFTKLLVDREGASPISVFQLPPNCGFSVTTTWSDLEMLVPYDACYITQENGSYVLPMLWWDIPLKFSCSMQMSTPNPSFPLSAFPSVFCSPIGMAVEIDMEELNEPMLGVIVKEVWDPFVSENCAFRVKSPSEGLSFFIPYSAPCITSGDSLHVHLKLDDQEYMLSCPVGSYFPYIPSPPWSPPASPGDPQFPYILDPISPASPPPPSPQPPTQEEIVRFPDHLHYLHPGLHNRPPWPNPDSLPGPQQQFVGPGKPLHYQDTSLPNLNSYQVSKLPFGPSQHPFGLHPAFVPFYYHVGTPAPKTTTPDPLAVHPPKHPAGSYYSQHYPVPYYPAPTAAPVTQAPPPHSPPKQPVGPQYQDSPFDPPFPYSSFYLYWPYEKLPSHPTAAPPLSFSPVDSPSDPSSHLYPPKPYFFHPTPPPPSKEDSQKPACPPYAHTICSSYPYYPYYHPLYPPHYHHPPVPPYPPVPSSTTATPSTTSFTTPAWPTPQCLTGSMVVPLPFAHPASIQVKDHIQSWISLSTVPPFCGYTLQTAEGSGVTLHSPLPACHSHLQTPTTVSLPIRFWDLSMEQYRTLDPKCPYPSIPVPPLPVTPSVFPTPPSTTNGPSVRPKTKVFCTSQQMTVELPSGFISEILVKDIKGNQMNLEEAPKHCGYSAHKLKDGKIRVSLRLHSRCHMSVQGKKYIITIAYMTVNGYKETPVSCPVVVQVSGQECNLPTEQRLPCGSGSVSQPQCLSMGCCFNKHPPACYYPMDECTIDRHFVFFVPASLADPPLSPAQLVAASNSTCKPQRVTPDYALFKIPMDGCGTRRVVVGKTVVYLVEIVNTVQSISLNYGTITRDSPVRLLVECRFVPGTVLSVSYVVKTPTLGPDIHGHGVFGVQLRIAKDAQYSSYYPHYHQPMHMLLGKPLHLEVRLLNSPDPSLVLLVNYCVAYPRSGNAVWLLLHDGCPNPLDPVPAQAVLSHPQPPALRSQTRRFTIRTFLFLQDGKFKDKDEEVYFMCSTEICAPRDRPCVEGCFGQ